MPSVKASAKNTPKSESKKPARRRKEPKYKHFRLSRSIKSKEINAPLPGFFSLLRGSLRVVRENRALFIGIIFIYSLLNIVFVAGLGSSMDFVQTKQQISDLFGANTTSVNSTLTLFVYLVDSTNAQAGEVAGAYQLFLLLITSLAVIWAVREVMAGNKISSKDAFYKGIFPLVPFILVLLIMGLQMLPFIIGSSIYSIVVSGGLAINSLEKIVWLVFFLLTALLSFYMLLSSIFAVYIVTLPDMTPMKALRSARGLVIHRRWSIGLRIIALPILMVVFAMLLLTPVVLVLPWLAVGLAIVLGAFYICLWHLYIYRLYRSML